MTFASEIFAGESMPELMDDFRHPQADTQQENVLHSEKLLELRQFGPELVKFRRQKCQCRQHEKET